MQGRFEGNEGSTDGGTGGSVITMKCKHGRGNEIPYVNLINFNF